MSDEQKEARWPLVDLNDDGIRPAGNPDECFYCRQKVGQPHGKDCVIVKKIVRVRYIIELNVPVPHDWTKEDVEFHRNDGTWCADNAVDEIDASQALEPNDTDGCLCHRFKAEFVSVVDDTPRRDLKTAEQSTLDAGMRDALGQKPETRH